MDPAVGDEVAGGLQEVDVGDPVADVTTAADGDDDFLAGVVGCDVATNACSRTTAGSQLIVRVEVREGDLPEGRNNCYGVAFEGGTAASASHFLAGASVGVAVCSSTMLDVELEVGEVLGSYRDRCWLVSHYVTSGVALV